VSAPRRNSSPITIPQRPPNVRALAHGTGNTGRHERTAREEPDAEDHVDNVETLVRYRSCESLARPTLTTPTGPNNRQRATPLPIKDRDNGSTTCRPRETFVLYCRSTYFPGGALEARSCIGP